MAPPCTVCTHPDRVAIEEAMVLEPTVNARIGARWDIPKDSIRRHRKHLSPALTAEIVRREKRRETGGPRKALDRLEDLYDRAARILKQAEEAGQGTLGLAAIRELRGVTETLARITGELDDSPKVAVVNVQTSPEWQQIRAVLALALTPHPEAARAVSAALQRLEIGTPEVIDA